MSTSVEATARWLARLLVAGPPEERVLVERVRRALGDRPRRWIGPAVARVLAEVGAGPRPRPGRVVELLLDDEGFRRACRHGLRVPGFGPATHEAMWPVPGPPSRWPVPAVTSTAMLADWLGVRVGALEWFADVQGRERRTPEGPRRHYDYRWMAKRRGGARLVESPRYRLKVIQRRLLDELLVHIPPHDAAHAYRGGRSILTNAGPHVGRVAVLTMDLRDFFPSIGAARVAALFRTAGYPEGVARALAGLCTNSAPIATLRDGAMPCGHPESRRLRQLYGRPHLPQGAPTSPSVANLCAARLDRRLDGLAGAAGARYSRYADDLTFSGGEDFARSARRFAIHAASVAMEEGFEPNMRKVRLMRRGARQRVAGVVVNRRPNVPREAFDALKATLHNCVRDGPGAQNRDARPDFRAHLAGRVAHVAQLHPEKGRRLRELFERIAW